MTTRRYRSGFPKLLPLVVKVSCALKWWNDVAKNAIKKPRLPSVIQPQSGDSPLIIRKNWAFVFCSTTRGMQCADCFWFLSFWFWLLLYRLELRGKQPVINPSPQQIPRTPGNEFLQIL